MSNTYAITNKAFKGMKDHFKVPIALTCGSFPYDYTDVSVYVAAANNCRFQFPMMTITNSKPTYEKLWQIDHEKPVSYSSKVYLGLAEELDTNGGL